MLKGLDTVEEFWTPIQVEMAKEKACDFSLPKFRSAIGLFLGVPKDRVHFAPSGGKSLEWLLKSRSDSRRTVMVPAFNCSVVFDSILSAGYHLQLYDFNPSPGLFNWKRVLEEIKSDVGVLIITHYFGIPVDFREVLEFCRVNGIAVIEDCAHTLGAKISGNVVGTMGDASIFSFNYDKPISLGWGGFCLINNENLFKKKVSCGWVIPNAEQEMLLINKFMVAMKSRRKMIRGENSLLFKILRRLMILNKYEFNKDSRISVGAIQAELGIWCLSKYKDMMKQRNSVANHLSENILLDSWPIHGSINPAYIKLKTRISNGDLNVLSSKFQFRGIRVGNFNWPVHPRFEGLISNHPNSLDVACNWVDIPIHQNMNKSSLRKIVKYFNRI